MEIKRGFLLALLWTYVDEAFEVGSAIAHRQVADADGFYYLSVNSASPNSQAEVRYKLEWNLTVAADAIQTTGAASLDLVSARR